MDEKYHFPGPDQRARKKLQNRSFFYMETLKSKVLLSHLNFFFFFVALFWLNLLTRGHTKSQPDTWS